MQEQVPSSEDQSGAAGGGNNNTTHSGVSEQVQDEQEAEISVKTLFTKAQKVSRKSTKSEYIWRTVCGGYKTTNTNTSQHF